MYPSNGGTTTTSSTEPETGAASTSSAPPPTPSSSSAQPPSDPRIMSSDFHREYASALNDVGVLLHRAGAASTSASSSSTLGSRTMRNNSPSHEEERALLYFQRAVQIRLTDLAAENESDVDSGTRVVTDEMRRDYESLLEEENQLMLHLLELTHEGGEEYCYHQNGNEPLDMYDMAPTASDAGRLVGDELRALEQQRQRVLQQQYGGGDEQDEAMETMQFSAPIASACRTRALSSSPPSNNDSGRSAAVLNSNEEEIRRRRRRTYRRDCQDSAVTLYNMALMHHRSGVPSALDKAYELFRMALSLCSYEEGNDESDNDDGSDRLDVATASSSRLLSAVVLNNMGQIHYRRGEYDECLERYADALRRLDVNALPVETRGMGGGEVACVASSLSGMCRVHHSVGDADEADELNGEVLRLHEFLRGENVAAGRGAIRDFHTSRAGVDMAVATYNAGVIAHRKGDLAEATVLVETFLRNARSLWGGHRNVHVATALHTLGLFWGEAGRTDLARHSLSASLRIRRAVHGEDHTSVAVTRCALGRVCRPHRNLEREALGHYSEALRIYKRTCVAATNGVQRYRCDVVDALCSVGEIHHSRMELDRAPAAYAEALVVLREIISTVAEDGDDNDDGMGVNRGAGDEHVAGVLNTIASIHMERGEIRDAAGKFAEASRILSSILGAEPLSVVEDLDGGILPAAPAA